MQPLIKPTLRYTAINDAIHFSLRPNVSMRELIKLDSSWHSPVSGETIVSSLYLLQTPAQIHSSFVNTHKANVVYIATMLSRSWLQFLREKEREEIIWRAQQSWIRPVHSNPSKQTLPNSDIHLGPLPRLTNRSRWVSKPCLLNGTLAFYLFSHEPFKMGYKMLNTIHSFTYNNTNKNNRSLLFRLDCPPIFYYIILSSV